MAAPIEISVVIPARNRATVLKRALESIKQQSLQPKEVIVVDDGSTDETVDAAKEFAKTYPILTVIELKKNGGAPNARNIGIRQASCPWVALLDSDDAWLSDKLERQSACIDDGTVAVFTNTKFVYPDKTTETTYDEGIVDAKELRYRNVLGGCSAAFLRKSSVIEVGFFDTRLPSCQDWDLWLKLADIGNITRVSPPATVYYFDAANRISKNPSGVMAGHSQVYERIYSRLSNAKDISKLKRFHQFHMAQTKIYWTGINNGVCRPAISNLIYPQSPITRSSAAHLLYMAIRSRMFGRIAQ
jgi:glycosyltransferase involved in cell wall biosynthesis